MALYTPPPPKSLIGHYCCCCCFCRRLFSGISCYFPLLSAHLQWLGFDLQEIGIINLIASVGAAFGLLLAATWTPRCGHRSNLAIAVLLAAFCGAGLVLVPRLNGRPHGRPETERPVAEILCRPEGSALFFRKCGDSCELDAVTRTELSVSDCRFEPQSRLPVNFLDWINRFALTNANSGGKAAIDDDLSEPERGDLPQKIPSQPSGHEDGEQFEPTDVETEDLSGGQSGSSPSGIAPYDYDYEENHRPVSQGTGSQEPVSQEVVRRRKRQSVPIIDDSIQLPPQQQLDEFEIAEKADLPYTSSPHICFSSYSSSTTTCNNHCVYTTLPLQSATVTRPYLTHHFLSLCCVLFRSRFHGNQSSFSVQHVLLLWHHT